jgi:hypothetical protein
MATGADDYVIFVPIREIVAHNPAEEPVEKKSSGRHKHGGEPMVPDRRVLSVVLMGLALEN